MGSVASKRGRDARLQVKKLIEMFAVTKREEIKKGREVVRIDFDGLFFDLF